MSRTVLAAAALSLAALLAAATTSVAQDQNNPIPGIDIIVKKQPAGGLEVIARVGRDGGFVGQVKLAPGNYIVRTACSKGVRCRPNRLTSLSVNGRSMTPDASGGVRISVGDINGDGQMDLTVFRGTVRVER